MSSSSGGSGATSAETGLPAAASPPPTSGFAVIPIVSTSKENSPLISGLDGTTLGSACHLKEAISLYVYALRLVQGAIVASQRVQDVVRSTLPAQQQQQQQSTAPKVTEGHHALLQRCELSLKWMMSQFNSILERAEAGNVEMAAVTSGSNQAGILSQASALVPSAQELIYNHAVKCGREGSVKLLMGQVEGARAGFKMAGILTEALLMENLQDGDRASLLSFVGGVMEKIKEVDRTASAMLSQGSLKSVMSAGESVEPTEGV